MIKTLQPDPVVSNEDPDDAVNEVTMHLWTTLLTAYRNGPRSLYAPVILGLLESRIESTARRLRPPVPGLTEEDIRQELVVRVLQASLEMPLTPDSLWIPRRLMLRARTGVGRWLAEELREQSLADLVMSLWGRP